MLREWLSRRPLAFERFDYGRPRGALGRQLVLGRVGLGVLQLQLQLVEQPLGALRAHATEDATQLFDFELEISNQRVGARYGGPALIPIGFRLRCARFALDPRRPLGNNHRMCGDEIRGKRFNVA